MAHIDHPNERQVRGPWLLDSGDLEELDLIVEKINCALREACHKCIESDIRERMISVGVEEDEFQRRFEEYRELEIKSARNNLKCSVQAKDGRRIHDSSFRRILQDPTIKDVIAHNISVLVSHGKYQENEFEFKIAKEFDGALTCSLYCTDSQQREELQYEIDKWISARSPNLFMRVWSIIGPVVPYLDCAR